VRSLSRTRLRGQCRDPPDTTAYQVASLWSGDGVETMAHGDPRSEDNKLSLFVERATELGNARLLKTGGLRTDWSVTFGPGGTEATTYDPDEDDFRSYLLTFRQFVSDDEPIFVNRVASILWQRITDDEFRFNGERLRPEGLLDLWINGIYFHNDAAKAEKLKRLDGTAGTFARTYSLTWCWRRLSTSSFSGTSSS
jgi:hypothetical protein